MKKALFFLLIYVSSVFSLTPSLNGYFEAEIYKSSYTTPFRWNVWRPKNRLELKLSFSDIAYLSFAGETNYNYLRFLFNQAHLRYASRWYDLVLFAREDRHWIDSPLLRLVDSERARDDSWGAKAEGVRLDIRNLKGFSGVVLVSKFNVTESGYLELFRLGYDFGDRFYIGPTYIKKEKEIYSLLWSYKFGRAYVTFEGAKTRDDFAYEIEFHGLRFKNLHLNVRQYVYGKDFKISVSKKFNMSYDREFDRTGLYTELIYLFPRKAITATYKSNIYKTSFRFPAFLDNYYLVFWNYGELYIEYLGGLSSKLAFEITKDDTDIWKHGMFELGGENQLVKLKLQYKIKDIGVNTKKQDDPRSVGQREILGLELRVNLPLNFQWYSRAVLGNGIANSWESAFFQLSYRGFSQTELYLEYGDPQATENDLVNDPDVADYIYQRVVNQLKLLVKFYF